MGVLAIAVPVAIVASLRLGAVGLGWSEVWTGLTGAGEPAAVTILRDLRLPRALLAAVVGGSLGLAGAALQALLRNPLADPYVLGVSGGAAVGAVLAFGLGWGSLAWGVPIAALMGAALAIALVLRIASGAGGAIDVRVLLLAGVVVGAFFTACILLILSLQEAEAFRAAIFWMMGGLAGARWSSVIGLTIVLVVATAILLGLSRSLDLIAHGEETAGFLGVPVGRVRLVTYLTASLLTAGCVVVAGGIGFVGLFVPHTVRMIWGADHRFLLPATILTGAAFLPLADAVARVAAAPRELPLGVVTAFVGVPFFVGILRREMRSSVL